MRSSIGLTENPAQTRQVDHATPSPLDSIVSRAYGELRAIAHHRLLARGRGGPGTTLSTTALVHEAYLKLADQEKGWRDDPHFLAVASLAMRHVLVDRARERAAVKRGGGRRPITLDERQVAAEDQPEAILQLDDALNRLAAWNPRVARVVECRFFGGLSEIETAHALGLTVRTVQRDWAKARVLLRRALDG